MDMLTSKAPGTQYRGIKELATGGLHAAAFALFSHYVPRGSSVLDLGSGAGAWPTRLHDAKYDVTAADLEVNARTTGNFSALKGTSFPFVYKRVDLNGQFADEFDRSFDAVSIVEVIEHLENPRQVMRQMAQLLKPGGYVLLTTPNASGLYSRLRFVFTGQMAMFTDASYREMGHITPLTVWQLEKIFEETRLTVVERRFHDGKYFPPRSMGDVAKIVAWGVFRWFMFGPLGGQVVLYLARRTG
jgi:2-polyprenyl-3-methyl-5-hydroxy-6-metoxy-1,4-benzoquinol methylase